MQARQYSCLANSWCHPLILYIFIQVHWWWEIHWRSWDIVHSWDGGKCFQYLKDLNLAHSCWRVKVFFKNPDSLLSTFKCWESLWAWTAILLGKKVSCGGWHNMNGRFQVLRGVKFRDMVLRSIWNPYQLVVVVQSTKLGTRSNWSYI